jgi:hypothetical protein
MRSWVPLPHFYKSKRENMKLNYVLVVPNGVSEHQATLFQGWNPAIKNPKFLSLISLLSALPFDKEEIFLSQSQLIKFRATGAQRNVVSVGESFLSELTFGEENDIVVFLALEESLQLIKDYHLGDHKKTIILSASEDLMVIDIRRYDRALHMIIDEAIFALIPKPITKSKSIRTEYDTVVSFPKNHGINTPSMAVLQSLGYTIEKKAREINDSFEQAEQLIVDSANLVIERLRESEWHRPNMVLYCPSVKSFFYDFKNIGWNNLLRDIPEKWKRTILESTFKNPGYSEFMVKIDGNLTNPYSDKTLGPILSIRQSELHATSLSIALMASNENLVAIRLPNILNLQGARLRHLESLSKRSDLKAARLIQREFRNYVDELDRGVGLKLIGLVKSGGPACKLCSDVPLEWLSLGNLPLMIAREVSRTPMTPGNSQLQYASTGERIGFYQNDFKKILVIRSFEITDPLLKIFEKCLDDFKMKERLDITVVDVASGEQAMAALNEYSGYIVVFDCHGDHGGNTSYGWLQFGKEKINTWELAYKARVPPIVLLSACSTSAVGGSHVSVAAGLLRSGAHSVLGTFLPIDGPRSAIFIARLLGRLDTFLPLMKKLGAKIISWRTFVHGAMQLSYLTDVLVYFRFDLELMNDELFEEIEKDALVNVSLANLAWFDIALEKISKSCSLSVSELVEKISADHPLMETLRYCQVGFPERIGIVLNEDN